MWARRLTTILPPLILGGHRDHPDSHSVAGLTDGRLALVTTRPFRAPYHPIAAVGVIGGGAVPLPGEVSLAHYGWNANAGGIAGVHTASPQPTFRTVPSHLRHFLCLPGGAVKSPHH
jgi:Magnesium chelatase, subunit ChlI